VGDHVGIPGVVLLQRPYGGLCFVWIFNRATNKMLEVQVWPYLVSYEVARNTIALCQ
jgi:hypothetical protein